MRRRHTALHVRTPQLLAALALSRDYGRYVRRYPPVSVGTVIVQLDAVLARHIA